MILYNDEICAKTLLELNVPHEDIEQSEKILESSDELCDALSCPAVAKEEKYAVIDKIFPQGIRNFLKVMTDFDHMNEIKSIFKAYKQLELKSKNVITAEFSYVNRPDDNTIDKFKEMLKKKYGASDVVLNLKEDKTLIGGCKLTVGDTVYDKSIQGTIKALQSTLIRR